MLTSNGSYILDCLVGDIMINSFSGWVGFVLSMNNAKENMNIKNLGRFNVPNNKDVHDMNIIQVVNDTDYKFLVPINSYKIDMNECILDLNGFCYAQDIKEDIELMMNETYFIAPYENKNGDYFLNMTGPATGTKYSYRDGKTYMSYLAPNKGQIIEDLSIRSNTMIYQYGHYGV